MKCPHCNKEVHVSEYTPSQQRYYQKNKARLNKARAERQRLKRQESKSAK